MTSPAFSRPRPKRSAPSASEAFMAGATANALDPSATDTTADAPVDTVAELPTYAPRQKPTRKPKEPEVVSQTVRFTEREKHALIALSEAERRSEHQIIKDILGPALLARAAALDQKTGAP